MELTLQLLKYLAVFAVIGFGSRYVLKKVKKTQLTQISEGMLIQAIDGLYMGNQKVVLLKVGDEYILWSTGTNGETFEKLDQKVMPNVQEKFDDLFQREHTTSAFLQDTLDSFKGKWVKKQ